MIAQRDNAADALQPRLKRDVGSKRGEGIHMIHKIPILIIMVLVVSAVPALAGNAEKEDAAVISAEKWLGMVDAEKYSESWKEAAELLRSVNREARLKPH